MLEKVVVQQHLDFLHAHGWRTIRTHPIAIPGMINTGEPGMCDYEVIRYMPVPGAPWRTITFWLEIKSPDDRRGCRCKRTEKGRVLICQVCRQKNWQAAERLRGAVVIVSNDLDRFAAWYEREFSWLHQELTQPVRQLNLLG